MTRTAVAVAVAVAVSLVPAGCGGEEDEARGRPRPPAAPKATTTPAEAPARQEFIRKADALCAETRRWIAPIYAAVKAKVAGEDPAGVAAELRRAIPIAGGFLDSMRALTPPRGDAPVLAMYFRIVAGQKRRIGALIEALEAEDISTIEVLASELNQGNRRAQRLARRYGFTKCGPGDLPLR